MEFLEKLAALVPRPRVHLTRFHGVLAPNTKHRKHIIPTPPSTTPTQEKTDQSLDDKKNGSTKKKCITWAQLLKRVFKIDIEICNVCGGKMAVISAITDPEVIQKILEHLKLPTRSPKIHPSRGPPQHHCKWLWRRRHPSLP
ncbi:MAG: transposase [Bdellovibrionales bacterium]|nr:transposase [Bdellovibrionales bacterium]